MIHFVDEPEWIAPVFDFVDAALFEHPPACPAPVERQEALMALDGPLHLEAAPRFRSTHAFLVRRMRWILEEIEQTTVTEGARIWHLYNHGFVVRTPSVTFGMDLVRGWVLPEDQGARRGVSLEEAARLADQLDVMTLSHNHDDHVDPVMRDLLFERGIPILAPPGVFPEIGDHPLLHRPQREDRVPPERYNDPNLHWLRPLRLAGGKEIECAIYPGHQGGDLLNNLYLFRTEEGLVVLHTGDQSYEPDLGWIVHIGDHHPVDALLANCWTYDMLRMVRGVRPRLTLTGHEVELSHGPDHREAYWRSFQIFRDVADPPSLVMGWGEGVHYRRGLLP